MEVDKKFTKIGKNYGIAVVGLGEGDGLVKGLVGHPELKLQAICDIDEKLARSLASLYNIEKYYSDIAKMLKDDSIDIVVIYTPDQYHLAHITSCIEAGKDVICTKPLVTSLEEAKQLREFIKNHPKRRVMVGQSTRFFAPFIKQREAFESGKMGEISYLETHYNHDMRWFYEKRSWTNDKSFDLLFACASHPVDLVRWYMGDPVEVFAYASRTKIAKDAGFQGNDVFSLNFKFADGRIARAQGLYGAEYPHQTRPWIELSLYGDTGSYIAKYPQLETIQKFKDTAERQEYYFEDIFHHFQFEGIKHHAGEFVNYTEYFARKITQNQPHSPDVEDGYRTMVTLEALRSSINTGQPTKVIY